MDTPAVKGQITATSPNFVLFDFADLTLRTWRSRCKLVMQSNVGWLSQEEAKRVLAKFDRQ